jgi:hypothetical protein
MFTFAFRIGIAEGLRLVTFLRLLQVPHLSQNPGLAFQHIGRWLFAAETQGIGQRGCNERALAPR